jgi:streptomycin 6-kinase
LIHLPENLTRNIVGVHQDKGVLWLKNFETLTKYCEETWSLQIMTSPYPLSYNYVAPVVFHDGSEAVLKLGVPSKEIDTEIEALRLYQGNGMARLIDADADKGILILERVKPGDTLKTIKNDEEATLLAAEVMRKIRVPAPENSIFPSTAQWAKGLERLRQHYNGGTGPIPERMVRKAEDLYAKLNSTVKNPQLLHGDLHHDNILSAEREPWLAIDPKGLIGDPEYQVISFLMNNLPGDHAVEIIKRRIDLFVEELDLHKDRVLAWAYSHSILSTWWCIEDHTDGVDDAIQTAEMFETLLNE